MSYLNQALLIGRLGKDPVILKEDEKGHFVKLNVCTNKKYKVNGVKKERAEWHTVLIGNKRGTFVSTYLKKGDRVFVSGELCSHEWTDKNGAKRTDISILAKECKPLSQKKLMKSANTQD